uniref:Uncharacterized protein n=1 Tax=Cacopsylla melanoneura TaxID=428564 RepID=A0A8D8Y9Q1_9HEMI
MFSLTLFSTIESSSRFFSFSSFTSFSPILSSASLLIWFFFGSSTFSFKLFSMSSKSVEESSLTFFGDTVSFATAFLFFESSLTFFGDSFVTAFFVRVGGFFLFVFNLVFLVLLSSSSLLLLPVVSALVFFVFFLAFFLALFLSSNVFPWVSILIISF